MSKCYYNKKVISYILALFLLLGCFICNPMDSYAAAKRPIKSISLNTKKVTLIAGRSTTLKATVKPKNTTQSKKVIWSTSNKKVATVNSKGKVTAKKAGTVTITAKSKANKKKKATCKIIVKKAYPLKSISIKNPNSSLYIGEVVQLSVNYNPSNTTDNKVVTWSSSNNSIATVLNGKVTAKKEGTVKISAKVGNKTAVTSITVQKKEITLTKLSLNAQELQLKVGNAFQLKANKLPSNTTNTLPILWSSFDPDIASVNNNGFVNAKQEGSTIIVARCGSIEESIIVSISNNSSVDPGDPGDDPNNPHGEIIPATKIEADISNNYELVIDEIKQINVSFTPSNTTNKTIYWSSTRPAVASITSDGKITAKSIGTTIITGISVYPVDSIVINLSVVAQSSQPSTEIPLTQLQCSPNSVDLDIGENIQLQPVYYPSNTTQKGVTFSQLAYYQNKGFVDVTSEGLVTAKKYGTSHITLTSNIKPNISGSCTINVKPKNIESLYFDITEEEITYLQTKELPKIKCIPEKEQFTNDMVTWTTSNNNVNIIGNEYKGLVVGECIITATYENKSASFKVIIKEDEGQYIEGEHLEELYYYQNQWRTDPKNWWYWNYGDETITTLTDLQPLNRNLQLEGIAKIRAKNAWERWYIQGIQDHCNPDGSHFTAVWPEELEFASGSNDNGGPIHRNENLTNRYDSYNVIYNGFAEESYGYMQQGHRRTMLATDLTEMGAATYKKNGVCITCIVYAGQLEIN